MKKYHLFLVFFTCVLFPTVLFSSEKIPSVRDRVIELIKSTPVDPEIVSLEPFVVSADSAGVDFSRELHDLERHFESLKGKDSSMGHFKLPFKFDSVDSGVSPYIHVQDAKMFRVVHGGIKISDNATLYFKTGVLWGEERKGKLQFYLPFRYRSAVGIGWKKKF